MVNQYEGYEELVAMRNAKNYNASISQAIKTAFPKTSMKLLDFGAGIGTLATFLRDDGYSVDCLEIDKHQTHLLESEGFQVYQDLSEVPSGTFNGIYSSNVLEHIANDEAVLKILRDKLNSKGHILLHVPAFPILFTDMDRKVGHHRRYNHKALKSKLEANGYSVLQWYYADSLGFFATLILKLFNRGADIATPRKIQFYDRFLFPFSQLLDKFFYKILGKNLYMLARKD